MNTFYTTDPHFGHSNIILYSDRPFYKPSDVAAHPTRGREFVSREVAERCCVDMDNTIIKNWNSRVGPKDEVYLLGDFCFGDIYFACEMLRELNGKIKYIFGNHDKTMKQLQREMRSDFNGYSDLKGKLEFMGDLRRIEVEGQGIIISHYPLMTWEKKHRGTWMLHGHCHYNLPITRIDATYGKILDIALEGNNYLPYAHEEIAMIMSRKQINPPDPLFSDHHVVKGLD